MKQDDTIKNRLLDIELPVAPPEAIDYTTMSLVFVSIIIVMIFSVYALHRSGLRYKISISLLKKQLHHSLITPKAAAYRLADILKSAYKTTNLSTSIIKLPEPRQTAWDNFIARLSSSRYGPDKDNQIEVVKLLDDAKYWVGVHR